MSINSLLTNPGSKPWADLYVDSLTCYSGLTVNGDVTHNGGAYYQGDVVIDGALQLSNANNSTDTAMEIIGDYKLKTAGQIQFTAVSDLPRIDGNDGVNYQFTPKAGSAASANLAVRAVEIGNIINLEFLYFDAQNPHIAPANARLEWDYPVGYPDKFKIPNYTYAPIFVEDQTGVTMGSFAHRSDNGGYIEVRRMRNDNLLDFVQGEIAQLVAIQTVTFQR